MKRTSAVARCVILFLIFYAQVGWTQTFQRVQSGPWAKSQMPEGYYPELVDWDKDGSADILLVGADKRVKLFLKRGEHYQLKANFAQLSDGSFLEEHSLLRQIHHLTAIDFNQDGRMDLVIGLKNRNYFELFLQNESGKFDMNKILIEDFVHNHLSANFLDSDRDGDLDIITGAEDGKVYLLRNNGSGFFSAEELKTFDSRSNEVSLMQLRKGVPELLDWNHDGKEDLLLTSVSGKMWIYLRDDERDILFHKQESLFFQGQESILYPNLLDLDHDDELDLIMGIARPNLEEDFLSNLEVYIQKGAFKNIKLISPQQGAETTSVYWVPSACYDQRGKLKIYLGKANGDLRSFTYENYVSRDFESWNSDDFEGALRSYAAPDCVDWDEDGLNDLIVGTADNGVYFLQGFIDPDTSNPNFRKVGPALLFYDSHGNEMNLHRPIVRAVDWNHDQSLDLIVGTEEGKILLFLKDENDRLVLNEDFPKLSDQSIPSFSRHAAPALYDYNFDGLMDIVVTNQDGAIKLLKQKQNGTFDLLDLTSNFQNVYPKPVPYFVDLDGDAKVDMLLGGRGGLDLKGYLFKNDLRRDFSYLGIQLGTRVSVNSVDWDRDGDFDLILGNAEGMIRILENLGEEHFEFSKNTSDVQYLHASSHHGPNLSISTFKYPESANYTLLTANSLGRISQIAYLRDNTWFKSDFLAGTFALHEDAVPHIFDFNSDGILDIVIGDKIGQIKLYQGNGQTYFSTSTLDTIPHFFNAAPLLIDFDQDGDVDLLVGTLDQGVFLFTNNGSNQWTNKKLPLDEHRHAKPWVMDWNQDGKNDLLIGDESGTVSLYLQVDENNSGSDNSESGENNNQGAEDLESNSQDGATGGENGLNSNAGETGDESGLNSNGGGENAQALESSSSSCQLNVDVQVKTWKAKALLWILGFYFLFFFKKKITDR